MHLCQFGNDIVVEGRQPVDAPVGQSRPCGDALQRGWIRRLEVAARCTFASLDHALVSFNKGLA